MTSAVEWINDCWSIFSVTSSTLLPLYDSTVVFLTKKSHTFFLPHFGCSCRSGCAEESSDLLSLLVHCCHGSEVPTPAFMSLMKKNCSNSMVATILQIKVLEWLFGVKPLKNHLWSSKEPFTWPFTEGLLQMCVNVKFKEPPYNDIVYIVKSLSQNYTLKPRAIYGPGKQQKWKWTIYYT